MRERTVYFLGKVDEANMRGTLSGIQEISRAQKRKTIITLYVTSPGGYFPLAVAFYDLIRTEGTYLKTIALGQVSSAAILIFLAGEKRLASSHTRFHVHEMIRGWDSAEQLPLSDLEKVTAETKAEQELMCKILAEGTGLPAEKWEEISRAETFLTAQQAQEYGLVHRII